MKEAKELLSTRADEWKVIEMESEFQWTIRDEKLAQEKRIVPLAQESIKPMIEEMNTNTNKIAESFYAKEKNIYSAIERFRDEGRDLRSILQDF